MIASRALMNYRVIGNDDNFPLHDGMKHAIIGIPTGRERWNGEFLPGLNGTCIKCARPGSSTTVVRQAVRGGSRIHDVNRDSIRDNGQSGAIIRCPIVH